MAVVGLPHGGSIYTTDIGKCSKSGSQSTILQNVLLSISCHITWSRDLIFSYFPYEGLGLVRSSAELEEAELPGVGVAD